MRLTRVYLPHPLHEHQSVELPHDTAAHVVKVLRARVDDELILFNGDGNEYLGRIETARGDRVLVAVAQRHDIDRESALHAVLVQSVPRGDRMDFVVQKATELGVKRIVPVLSRRSVVRLDAKQAASKLEHWRGVAISACEQCGRNELPEIDTPRDLLDHLAAPCAEDLRIVLDPAADAGTLPVASPGRIEITVGPEGGFDTDELAAMRLVKVLGIKLGPRILRTETAALVALTWLQTRYGDFNPV
jgi:16S rRNA (uracil1498-N3)-methyltransferase